MAYRRTNSIVTLAILGLAFWAAWNHGVPWLKRQGFMGGSTAAANGSPSADCVSAADDAVAVWNRGIVRFMNPPIDSSAWMNFRAEVERKIYQSRSACSCSNESCMLARVIGDDLEEMVSDMDAIARGGGPPPGDLVRSQERLDLKIEQAWKLAEGGQ